MFKCPFLLAVVVSCAFCCLMLSGLESQTVPWMDEVFLADTPASILSRGEFNSSLDLYAYNPLFLFMSLPWLYVFGVSHFTVCSLNVFIALLASILCLKILKERQLVVGPIPSVVFVLLFWSGIVFTPSIGSGRPDIVALTTTVLFLDRLTRPTATYWGIFITAFLSFLSAAYHIPTLFFFGVVLLMLPLQTMNRKEWFHRGNVAATGCFVALAFMGLFYFLQHGFFRFVYCYLRFNATLAASTRDWAGDFIAAYMSDLSFLILAGIGLFLMMLPSVRKAVRWKFFIFVLSLPALQVIAGRYVWYYAWIPYVSLVFLFSVIVSSCQSMKIRYAICALTVLYAVSFWSVRFIKMPNEDLALIGRYRVLLERNADLLRGTALVIADCRAYYPAYDTGAVVWDYRSRLGRDDLSQQEKFTRVIKGMLKNPRHQQKADDFFRAHEHQMKLLPEGSFFLVSDKDFFVKDVVGKMEKKRLSYTIMDRQDSLLFIKITRDGHLPNQI